jgi:hypothetical protein
VYPSDAQLDFVDKILLPRLAACTAAVFKELQKSEMTRVAKWHIIFHSVFMMRRGMGHAQNKSSSAFESKNKETTSAAKHVNTRLYMGQVATRLLKKDLLLHYKNMFMGDATEVFPHSKPLPHCELSVPKGAVPSAIALHLWSRGSDSVLVEGGVEDMSEDADAILTHALEVPFVHVLRAPLLKRAHDARVKVGALVRIGDNEALCSVLHLLTTPFEDGEEDGPRRVWVIAARWEVDEAAAQTAHRYHRVYVETDELVVADGECLLGKAVCWERPMVQGKRRVLYCPALERE